jgi:hypothetical protein
MKSLIFPGNTGAVIGTYLWTKKGECSIKKWQTHGIEDIASGTYARFTVHLVNLAAVTVTSWWSGGFPYFCYVTLRCCQQLNYIAVKATVTNKKSERIWKEAVKV